MSEENDLIARWSRRKRAARSLEARSSGEVAQAAGAPAAEAEADRPLPATGPGAAEPPEPIPSIEDITADGDLSAFLRKDVPTALKNAAMRKMWSLDPAIRDHVGLAEYSWDFNQPGSMPGFGPLAAGKAVADFLSTSGTVTAGSEGPPPQAPAPASERATAVAPERASGHAPDESAQPPVTAEAPSATEVAVAPGTDETAGRGESGPAPRQRHGGALPR